MNSKAAIALAMGLFVVACLYSQTDPLKVSSPVPVPTVIKFTGTLKPRASPGVVGVTLAIYKEQEGGAPLWLETQNVHPDASDRFTVLLGSSKPRGVPFDLFTSGEARWIGVRVEGQPEQARVLLLSVPYAVKAADAETLGGRPASAFALAHPESEPSIAAHPKRATTSASVNAGTSTGARSATTAGSRVPAALAPTGAGTANYIARWTSSSNLANSVIFQTPSTSTLPKAIGIKTVSPAAQLDVEAGAISPAIQGVTSSSAFFAAAVFGHATGTSGVTRGMFGLADSPAGIGLHGIGATGGQFETGSAAGNIIVGRGLGFTRFWLDPVGNMHNAGNYRVDGGISAGGAGTFQIDAPGVPGGRLTVLPDGKVGINKADPATTLDVNGSVKARAGLETGNIFFDDGSKQNSSTYAESSRSTAAIEVAPASGFPNSLVSIGVPESGEYLVLVTIRLDNTANFFGQDNSRTISCAFSNEPTIAYRSTVEGAHSSTVTWHTIFDVGPSLNVSLNCVAVSGGMDQSFVFALTRRITAIKLGTPVPTL